MYKEFYLVPSKEYNKLINNCKEEVKDEQKQVKNPIDEKKLEDKKDLEYNNVDPQVLLKIYEKLNKMERNNNERNKIEYSLPENTSSSFQRSDGAKLIKYLNEKGLIDVDLNGEIRIPDTQETMSNFVDRDKTKIIKEKNKKSEAKYLPVFGENTPDHLRSRSIELINLLSEKKID